MIESSYQTTHHKVELNQVIGILTFSSQGPARLVIDNEFAHFDIAGNKRIDEFFAIAKALSKIWDDALAGWQADDTVEAAKEPTGDEDMPMDTPMADSEPYDPADAPF